MNKLIQDYHPLQYGTPTSPHNNVNFMYCTKEMFNLNTELQSLLEDFFFITSPSDNNSLTLTGNNIRLSERYNIVWNAPANSDNIKETISKSGTTILDNATNVRDRPLAIQDALFVARPKNGGIIFWTTYSSVVYIIQNVVEKTTEESFMTLSAFDKISTTRKFFFDYNSINTIVPEQVETYTPSVSIGRYDHRGYNLTRGGNTWFIYPYHTGYTKLIDTYYYDGGSQFLNDFEIIRIEDRAFLCLDGHSNFLVELYVPEEENP